MLTELLELLQAGGTYRVADLARRLETTPELIEVMLEDLARMGYLKPVGEECGGGCGGCSLAGLCAAGTPSTSPEAGSGRVWALAER